MAFSSRTTARGLHRVPTRIPAQPAEPDRKEERSSRQPRRRKIKYSLFSMGKGLDLPLLLLILVLLSVGLVMMFSASYAYGYFHYNDSYYFISRQAMFAVAGVIIMLLVSTVDYHQFHKFAPIIFAISVLLLLMILVLGKFTGGKTPLVQPKNDVYRWINLGVEFQPTEIAKFGVVVLFAHMISQKGPELMKTFSQGFLPFAGIIGLLAILILPEPHVSATVIICIIGFGMMLAGGTRFRYFAIFGGAAALLLLFLVVFSGKFGYAEERILGWFDPFNPPEGVDTYQTRQSLYAVGSGGLLGVGLGQSRQKYLYLPEPQNDFIFAIVCEELGMIGALIIMILFGALVWRAVYVSLNTADRFGALLGFGIAFQVGVQAVLNVCVVTNTLPNTGISLPFFSYGGSSLLMLLAEMGVLLNVSRHAAVE